MINRGNGTFVASPHTYSFDLIPTWMVAADLDHDGKVDLALITVFDFGQVPTLERLRNIGGANFQPLPRLPLTDSAYYLGVADLNNDGFPDLITPELMAVGAA